MKHFPKYYKYTCIVYNVYALMQYLLYASDEQLKKTFFYLVHPGSFDADMVKRLGAAKWVYYVSDESMWKQRLGILFKYRWRIRRTTIYAQDCHWMASWLIGNSKYIYLEDSPKCISLVRPEVDFIKFPPRTKLGIPMVWKYGTVFGHPAGTNQQCINRLLTQDIDIQSQYVRGKAYEKVDHLELWNKASDWKKSYILKVYDINNEVLSRLEKFQIWFLSSPLKEDANMTDEEIVQLYTPYFAEYQKQGLVIKPHPRDKFDYEKYFPQALVLKSRAPMQLLSEMLKIKVKQAVTICSSAVSSFDENETQVIRLGAKIHPKIMAAYGDR